AKGVAMIRAIQPNTERIVNFATTHLNADYPEDDEYFPGVRERQLSAAKGMMLTSIGEGGPVAQPDWPNDDWLILSGDLNIRGLGAVGKRLYPADTPNHGPSSGPPDAPINEWWERIGKPATEEPEYFYDAWGETTSELDHGATRDDEEGRLDYILMSRRLALLKEVDAPPDPACVQHVWIPPELEGISDHKPVAADINRANTHCNPRLAHRVTLAEAGG